MERKHRSDSVISAVTAFQNADNDIELPDGIEFRSEEEKVVWRQFSRARAREAWRDFDLVLLAKAVKLEVDIRKYQTIIDLKGPIIKNDKGTPIENPFLRVIDTLTRQQLAIIRSMSLNQTAQDPRTLNATGKSDADVRDVLKKHGMAALIAMPSRKNA